MTEAGLPQMQSYELVAELIDAVGWLCDGQSTPDELRRAVVAYEARKHARFGYTLSSAISAEETVQFSLRHTATGELCASMDVDPKTGEVTVQQAWV